eukprot:4942333-Prorocentrum_lima.AAC.1
MALLLVFLDAATFCDCVKLIPLLHLLLLHLHYAEAHHCPLFFIAVKKIKCKGLRRLCNLWYS